MLRRSRVRETGSIAPLRLHPPPNFVNLLRMVDERTLRAASGWLDLGLADEALYELQSLPDEVQSHPNVLELKLSAQMNTGAWNASSETGRLLCVKVAEEPQYFIHAAYSLHETGDTLAACNWLLRGPKALFEMAIFHYNLACYLWTLGESDRAKSHLKQAIAMDGSFHEHALKDRDLSGILPL